MSSQPNWDDFMTPDEMDEFEQWQMEQAEAAAGAGPPGTADADFEDIMDPAEIPLCNEYAATGYCSAGEDCLYIHGDACERLPYWAMFMAIIVSVASTVRQHGSTVLSLICGYYCVHPYSPELTAQHQAACSEALAAAGYQIPQGHDPQQQQQQYGPSYDNTHAQLQHRRAQPPPPPPAATGATDLVAADAAADKANGIGGAASPVSTDAAVDEADQDSAVVAKTVSAAIAAVVQRSTKEEEASAADDVADQLSNTHISSTAGASSS
eukprot:gene7108-7321_t